MRTGKLNYWLSRREFLKTGLILTASALLPGIVKTVDSPTAIKRIYIAPDDHTDYMWTADEATYKQAFLDMLDYYLNQADSTGGNQSDFQGRWNCDGSYWMWVYEKNRTQAQFARLIQRIRDGHISVPLNPLVVALGGTPAEAVIRGMYYSGHVERLHNLKFHLVYAIENQTMPYGLGALWAGAGAKYSWKGICGCASKVPDAGNRPYEIYWWTGPDGSKILMKWNSLENYYGMGGYAEARNPADVVEFVDTNSSFRTRYPYSVIGSFGKGGDDIETLTDEFINVAQAKTIAGTRRVIVSNEEDFFVDFENTYSSNLPSLGCSFGNEWELYVASLAETSAQVKRAVEKIRSAEALSVLVSMRNASFLNGRSTDRDQAWRDLGMYWEHDWTADGFNVSRTKRQEWQTTIADRIDHYVDVLYADALAGLQDLIQKSGTNLRFFAFNPLSWLRTGVADLPYTGSLPVHVIDITTGQETPSQIITLDGQQVLRILAQDVPSVGYKVFEVHSGAGQTFSGSPSADAATGVMQNETYSLTVAPRGAITSLKNKNQSNREFARDITGYKINDLGSSSGTLTIENAGPVSVTLKAVASSPLAHTTRITLVRGSNRIEIRNEITQNFSDVQKWRFGFEISSPEVWHEEVGAILKAKLTTNGGHYYYRNARYDWLTLNRYADISGAGVGVTLSNADCYFMQLGNSTTSMLDTSTPQISVLSGGQVDGAGLGITNQGGDSYFLQRFALCTHTVYSPAAAMRFAMEHQNPLITGVVTGGDAYPENNFSYLTVSNSNVLVQALKPAEDGLQAGLVVRLWNLSAIPAAFSLTLPFDPIVSATHITHIETPLTNLLVTNHALADTLNAWQIKTYALQTGSLDAEKKKLFLPLIAR
jgi:alpha-mannosidase